MSDDAGLAEAILRRPLVAGPLEAARETIAGRRVLITGAGGYIGTGLARLAAELGAAHLSLVDNGEHALYAIDTEIGERHPPLSRRAVYCDIRDPIATARCLAAERPDVVVHAAALKQLPLLEAHVREGVLTNTVGALNVASAAANARARAVVLISTDKAAQPSSALGATKRVAEQVFQELDQAGGGTRFTSVRFGNVFGSTGSVVPRFRAQIARGGPVTLTDPAMTRFFITRAEACQLVLAALRLALAGDERGAIYVLQVGAPLPIPTLAERLIGHFAAGVPISIEATGPRPGERLTERLVRPEEQASPTDLAGVLRIRSPSIPLVQHAVRSLGDAAQAFDEAAVQQGLARLVPEFAGVTPEARPGAASRA